MAHDTRFDDFKKVVLVWKMGSDSRQSIIAVSPITPELQHFLDVNLDFNRLPPSTVFMAARFVTRDPVTGAYTFDLFNTLDPDDDQWENICIQQIMTVTPVLRDDLLQAYKAVIPARFFAR